MYYFPFSCKLFFSFNLQYNVVFYHVSCKCIFFPYLFIFIQSFAFHSPAHEIFHTNFCIPFTCSWDFSYKCFAFHSPAHEIFHTKFCFPFTCSWDFSYKLLLSIHLLMRFFIQMFCFPFTCSWDFSYKVLLSIQLLMRFFIQTFCFPFTCSRNSKTIPQSAIRNTLSRRILRKYPDIKILLKKSF